MKHLEIERKFLLRPCSVKKFLKRHGLSYEAVPMEQFYLRCDAEGSERYRRVGDRYIHTVKSSGTLAREEREEEVDAATYRRMREQAASGLIEKIRYRVPVGEWLLEIDAFLGALKGLVYLEVEFASLEAAESFRLPDPFARLLIAEVSKRPEFTNGSLARRMRLPVLSEGLEAVLERIDEKRRDLLKASTAVNFGPYERTDIALRTLVHILAGTAEANRRAMLAGDRDPERLHQLRVALRKLRALLTQFGERFESDWLQKRRRNLRERMEETGALRDLEVALQRIPAYRKDLGAEGKAILSELEQSLKERQERERARLLERLAGPEWAEELAALEAFALGKASGVNERAADPILPVVAPKLKKLYKRILSDGAALGKESPAAEYHQMRIRVKKLRYLLEFFFATLVEEGARELLEALKELQTILGEHQDLSVQIAWLKELEEQAEKGAKRKALKRLRRKLERELRSRRKDFMKEFQDFRKRKGLMRRAICGD